MRDKRVSKGGEGIHLGGVRVSEEQRKMGEKEVKEENG